MTNLLLFGLSVCVWFAVWHAKSRVKTAKTAMVRLAVVALLCMPFNINDNVYTVIGNGESNKNFTSIFSFYQKAGGEATSVVSVLSYQNAKSTALSVVGIVNYQEAKEATVLFSLFSNQKSDKDNFVFLGVPLLQNSKGMSTLMVGIAGAQTGKICKTPIAFSFYQKESGVVKTFCIFGGF